ncbi:MAG: hypothetical protein H2058_15915 [Muricauda sp.]|nr:hypothetical protein [Allomuricauda sp.]MBA4746736.1 hypothetical protein [Allomuricauda sp.]
MLLGYFQLLGLILEFDTRCSMSEVRNPFLVSSFWLLDDSVIGVLILESWLLFLFSLFLHLNLILEFELLLEFDARCSMTEVGNPFLVSSFWLLDDSVIVVLILGSLPLILFSLLTRITPIARISC